MATGLALGLLLGAYNTLLSFLSEGVRERLYVPLNLGLTGTLLAWSVGSGGLSLHQVGLGAQGWRAGALVGGVAGLLLASPLWAVALLKKPVLGGPLASLRAPPTDRSVRGLLYQVLVRIPLGTALWEEAAFRGVLYALLAAAASPWAGALLTSAFFTLWHIGPSLRLWPLMGVPTTGRRGALAWAGMVTTTFAGGLLLVGLRAWTGHLAAPLLAHALINASARAAFFLYRGPLLGERGVRV